MFEQTDTVNEHTDLLHSARNAIPPKLLVVDDEPHIRTRFERTLVRAGYEVRCASCLGEARDLLPREPFDGLLLDLRLPDGNGIDWIPEVRKRYPGMAIVVITGVAGIETAVEAMRLGADNFLSKPVKMDTLTLFLQKSIEVSTLRQNHRSYQVMSRHIQPYTGKSPAMMEVMHNVQLTANNDAPILLQGETGVGKGVLARYIHEHSSRANRPFVEVNCSGLNKDMLSSELFGHVVGAFTGAVEEREGLLSIANGGTLFLDEIGDMDIEIQAHFLKVIEEREYRRLGEDFSRSSSFRLICASNIDLEKAALKGHFRWDLLFRINIFPIKIPPLRERIKDLRGLIEYILMTSGHDDVEIGDNVLTFLKQYSWPGNIRELRNVLERALILSGREPLKPAHFPGLGEENGPQKPTLIEGESWRLEDIEAGHILRVLDHYEQDTVRAAKALGISRPTLYRKLQKIRSSESS